MYLFGEGVKKDHKKVIEYWELGAKNNLDISQFNMAIMYLGIEKLKVKGFKVDLKKSLELLLKAAKQGNENAIEMSKMVLKASETLIN